MGTNRATRGKRAKQGALAFPCGWGGWRKGAGRKPKGERAGVSHKRKPALQERHPVHVTLRLRDGLMTEADDLRAHSRGMQGLAIRIAKRLNKLWDRRGKVFADRFHGRQLRTPREVRHALVYLLHNARRHGYSLAPSGPDPYSSGRWFEGWRGLRPDTLWPAPLARARSWLLRRGWRRLGLVERAWSSRPGHP